MRVNRNIPLAPARTACVKTFNITLYMARIIVPVIFLVVILQELDLLRPAARYFSPFLRLFGLPGEAALPLLLGFFINIYASLGAISALSLSPQEITIIAIMILTSHSLLLEAPVLNITGLSHIRSILLRIGAAFAFGFLLNLLYLLSGWLI